MSERPNISYWEARTRMIDVHQLDPDTGEIVLNPVTNAPIIVDRVEEAYEEHVQRPMNDEEWEQRKADEALHQQWVDEQAARPHPLLEQIAAMSDEDKAALRELLS